MRVDVHQHLWTGPLVEALERRRRLPFVRRDDDDGLCVIYAAGEPPSSVNLDAEEPRERLALLGSDGVDRALIALSSPLGIEALPRAEAVAIIDAHLEGVGDLGDDFAAWGPMALDGLCREDVDAALERGCVGVSLPAGACAPPRAVDAIHEVLRHVERRGVPLFIHPGPGLGQVPSEVSLGDPLWWPAVTGYVAQMQAAWLSLGVWARRVYPRLTLVFAMLAGGAPLLGERLLSRGGPSVEWKHPLTFYETSSYGPVAVEAMARRVGERQLLYGSDRPVAEPFETGWERVLASNAGWLAASVGAVA